jgi:hypothetical protein
VKAVGDKKYCPKCRQWKLLLEFNNDKNRIDKLSVYCNKCDCEIKRISFKKHYKENYNKNKDKILLSCQKYRNAHKEQCNKYHKKYREENREMLNKKQIKKRKEEPWKKILSNINTRCYNKKVPQHKWYGGRGIKCLITSDELKELWSRDKAYLMKMPSIDRIDNDGDYTFENCKFIENKENAIKDKKKKILQFTIDGKFIKEWESINEAGRQLKLSPGNICRILKGKRKTINGFIFKYKEIFND